MRRFSASLLLVAACACRGPELVGSWHALAGVHVRVFEDSRGVVVQALSQEGVALERLRATLFLDRDGDRRPGPGERVQTPALVTGAGSTRSLRSASLPIPCGADRKGLLIEVEVETAHGRARRALPLRGRHAPRKRGE